MLRLNLILSKHILGLSFSAGAMEQCQTDEVVTKGRLTEMIRDTVLAFCRSGLIDGSSIAQVEGLIGVTLESQEVFLISIKEQLSHFHPTTDHHSQLNLADEGRSSEEVDGRGEIKKCSRNKSKPIQPSNRDNQQTLDSLVAKRRMTSDCNGQQMLDKLVAEQLIADCTQSLAHVKKEPDFGNESEYANELPDYMNSLVRDYADKTSSDLSFETTEPLEVIGNDAFIYFHYAKALFNLE